jgi:hypothetical protein
MTYPDGSHAINYPVSIFVAGGSVLANLYDSRDRTTGLPNPVSTDSLGNLEFWAEPGNYTGRIDDFDFGIQVLEDPFEEDEASLDSEFLVVQCVVAQNTSGHRLLVPDADGLAVYADPTDLDHVSKSIWMSVSSWTDGWTARLVSQGKVEESTWNWTPGQSIWLGLDGQLTQTIPPEAAFIRRVAEVIDPTTIEFRPSQPIVVY